MKTFKDITSAKETDRKLISSLGVLEDFPTTSIWQDMEAELNLMLSHIRDALEDIEHFERPEQYSPLDQGMLNRLQGAAATIRRIHNLPTQLIEMKKQDIEAAQRAQEEK